MRQNEALEGLPDRVRLSIDRGAFNRAISDTARLLQIRSEDRLLNLLTHTRGENNPHQVLTDWVTQFKKLGAEPFSRWINSSLHHVSKGEVLQSLCGHNFDISDACLLGRVNVKLEIV